MEQEQKQPEAVTVVPAAGAPTGAPGADQNTRGRRGSRPEAGKDGRRNPRRRRDDRARSEFEQKIISIRRVARVVAGGRRFSFSVTLVAGDKKGRVGVGIGKAGDTALAIDKALKDAKRNMIRLNLTKSFSIPHEVQTKYASARVIIIPVPGQGIVAGSAVRIVLELAGVKDVTAKVISGSKNALNIARCTIKALSEITHKSSTKEVVAKKK